MFARFLTASGIQPTDTILDVGATGDRAYEYSNYVEAWYPHKERITAVGVDDASFLEQKYPGMTFRRADGRALPFADGSFDFAHASAVIEHVGSRSQQQAFLAELWRVCRKGIFVTTSNRWFPVEVHSVLPLLHWLPPHEFRAVLRLIGHDFLAEEANLNLMSRSALLAAARAAGIASARVENTRFAGWTSHILLIAHKSAWPGLRAAAGPS